MCIFHNDVYRITPGTLKCFCTRDCKIKKKKIKIKIKKERKKGRSEGKKGRKAFYIFF